MIRSKMMGFWNGMLFVGPRSEDRKGGRIKIEFLFADNKDAKRTHISVDEWQELVEFIEEQVTQHEDSV